MTGSNHKSEVGSINAKFIYLSAGALVLVVLAVLGIALTGQFLGWWSGENSAPPELGIRPASNQPPSASVRSSNNQVGDPELTTTCLVELTDRGLQAFFSECYGIGSINEIVEQKVIGPTGVEIIRKVPGVNRYTDVILRRGITSNMDFWAWRQLVVDGRIQSARTTMRITLLSGTGETIAIWEFTNAWPSGISYPAILGQDNVGVQFNIEELVVTYDTMVRTQ